MVPFGLPGVWFRGANVLPFCGGAEGDVRQERRVMRPSADHRGVDMPVLARRLRKKRLAHSQSSALATRLVDSTTARARDAFSFLARSTSSTSGSTITI